MIPKWLLRENHVQYEENRFDRAVKLYKERFGELDFNNESCSFTLDEWAVLLEHCIKVGRPASKEFPPESIGIIK